MEASKEHEEHNIEECRPFHNGEGEIQQGHHIAVSSAPVTFSTRPQQATLEMDALTSRYRQLLGIKRKINLTEDNHAHCRNELTKAIIYQLVIPHRNKAQASTHNDNQRSKQSPR